MITNLSWLKEVYNERIPCLDEAVIAAKLSRFYNVRPSRGRQNTYSPVL